jgi:hypothetical protein
MSDLTNFEHDVMRMLLSGEDSVLAILREQSRALTVSERRMTGVGFHTHFDIAPTAPRCTEKQSFEIGDITAQIEGAEHGAGFVLFIRGGIMSSLEGYTYDEPWPEPINKYKLTYVGRQRDLSKLHQKL